MGIMNYIRNNADIIRQKHQQLKDKREEAREYRHEQIEEARQKREYETRKNMSGRDIEAYDTAYHRSRESHIKKLAKERARHDFEESRYGSLMPKKPTPQSQPYTLGGIMQGFNTEYGHKPKPKVHHKKHHSHIQRPRRTISPWDIL